MREADGAHGAGRVRPPCVDGPVGEPQVRGEVTEEVEGQGRRPEELCPQALVIEALVRFDDRGASRRRLVRGGGEEGRARLAGVLEREATPGWPGRRACARDDRLGADRVPVRLPPPRLVETHAWPVVGHLLAPRYAVLGLPAV